MIRVAAPRLVFACVTASVAVCVLCLLGAAAATHLAQPAQWTTARLCAAAVAAAVSVFGIQQLCAARAHGMDRRPHARAGCRSRRARPPPWLFAQSLNVPVHPRIMGCAAPHVCIIRLMKGVH